MKNYKAYITKIDDLEKNLRNSLDYINWEGKIDQKSTIFIKPNFTYPYYKKGITTNPKLLKYLLKILTEKAGEVIIGESDGGNESFTADQSLKGHNIPEICEEVGAEYVNLSKKSSRRVEEEIVDKKVSVEIPELLLDDIDCFVSVPVLKVHVMTQVTLSMKNLWGCHPNTMRCLEHKNLDYKLPLLTKKLDPKIVLVDGSYALDNHGPMYGKAEKKNLLISSNNPVVSDSLGANIMGIPVEKVKHIQIAEKEGLGPSNLNNVDLNKDWKKHEMDFNVGKTWIDRLSVPLFKSKILAKLVMDSPLTPLIYYIGTKFRNEKEKGVADDLERYC